MKFARIIAATACVFAFLPAPPSSAATRTIDIPGRFFQPQRLTINVGDTVFWVNSSNERHSVRTTSDSAEAFGSSNSCPGGLLGNDCLRPGATYSHTFDRRGTTTYYCERHGSDARFPNCGMCGRIAVVVRKTTGSVSPTTPGSTSPTPTATSPSPTPDETASPSPSSISSSPIAAPGDDDTRSTSVVAIAAAAVVLLGGSGYLIYRTMIR